MPFIAFASKYKMLQYYKICQESTSVKVSLC